MSVRVRLGLLGLLAALLALATTVARGGASPMMQVSQAAARFPERALVLTLPRRLALAPADVEVRENGALVGRRRVVPGISAGAGGIGFVLVLDASNSMRGRPIADAVAAARAFAAQRGPAQSLGVITFNAGARTAAPPTTDAAAIARTLAARPRLVEGTRLRDAVLRAVGLLRASRIDAGSIVVLSDGADTGSTASTADVVAAARSANVRVFGVGLRSGQFAPDQLRALSVGTGGLYSEAASSSQLASIYRALGARLAREYLVYYQSTAEAGRHVYVTVRVPPLGAAGTAALDYVVPSVGGGTVRQSPWERFLLARESVFAVAALAALFAALAVRLAVRAARRPLARRMEDYVAVTDIAHAKDEAPGPLTRLTERSLSRSRRWQRFEEEVEIGHVPVSAPLLASAALLAALVVGPAMAIGTGQPLLLVLTPVPPFAARAWVRSRVSGVRRKFEEQLPDALQMLASAMRAGHGISGALAVVSADSSEPTRREFERALADERLGTPLEEALTKVALRMASGDLEQVALVAELHRETGGNTAEVIDRVHDTVRERAELARMIRTLTAQGRMARWILTALPIAVGLIASVLVPDYMKVLYTTGVGQVLLALAVVMVVVGSLAVKRLVEIEV